MVSQELPDIPRSLTLDQAIDTLAAFGYDLVIQPKPQQTVKPPLGFAHNTTEG